MDHRNGVVYNDFLEIPVTEYGGKIEVKSWFVVFKMVFSLHIWIQHPEKPLERFDCAKINYETCDSNKLLPNFDKKNPPENRYLMFWMGFWFQIFWVSFGFPAFQVISNFCRFFAHMVGEDVLVCASRASYRSSLDSYIECN